MLDASSPHALVIDDGSNTSDEEYQRQMEALLSYAAARTGLPLLDLR